MTENSILNNVGSTNERPSEIYSDEMQEIISKVPSRILIWGIPLLFAILLIIISISAFIIYPDTVSGRIKIRSAEIASVEAPISGYIDSVCVNRGASVKKGTTLAFLRCNMDLNDLLKVTTVISSDLKRMDTFSKRFELGLAPPAMLNLGDLEDDYVHLYEWVLLKKQWSIPQLSMELSDFLLKANSYKRRYVLTSPVDGILRFVAIVQKGSFVEANQKIFSIASNTWSVGVSMEIPTDEVNRIKVGQLVLFSMPHEGNGDDVRILGKITYVADEPIQDSFFICQVGFPDGADKLSPKLLTWMNRTGQVIVEEKSLLHRFIRSLHKH